LTTIVSQKVTRVTSHPLYYSMCLKCPPATQTQAVDHKFKKKFQEK